MRLIEGFLLLSIIIYTLVTTYIFLRTENNIRKMFAYVFSITFFIYSGYGIAYTNVDNRYFLNYIIFHFVFLLTMKIVFNVTINKKNNNKSDFIDINIISNKLTSILTLVFYITLFMPLIFPEFRLQEFFFPKLDIGDIYYKIAVQKNNLILKLSTTIQTFTIPFMFIYLYKKLISGKKYQCMTLVILWAYLEFLQYSYIGRYNLVIYVLLCSLIYMGFKNGKFIINKKKIIMLMLIFLILTPFLFDYMYIREGRTNEANIIESIVSLIEAETTYPDYYYLCEEYAGIGEPVNFLAWITTIPIPSFLWPNKPDNTASYIFTYLRTGKIYGEANYSSVLPSLLGESFLIFNMNLYFIEAMIIGFLIAIFIKTFEKYKSMTLYMIYFALLLSTIGRGGSASYIPVMINSSISIILFIEFIKCRSIKSK